jgi:penicillin-binding protein 1C
MKLFLFVAAVFALIIATTPQSPPAFATVRATAGSEARLLARDGRLLETRRTNPDVRQLDWVPLAEISAAVTERLIAAEDRRFASHHGIDWQAVAGAIRSRFNGSWV